MEDVPEFTQCQLLLHLKLVKCTNARLQFSAFGGWYLLFVLSAVLKYCVEVLMLLAAFHPILILTLRCKAEPGHHGTKTPCLHLGNQIEKRRLRYLNPEGASFTHKTSTYP
jgi:hypothetical protein